MASKDLTEAGDTTLRDWLRTPGHTIGEWTSAQHGKRGILTNTNGIGVKFFPDPPGGFGSWVDLMLDRGPTGRGDRCYEIILTACMIMSLDWPADDAATNLTAQMDRMVGLMAGRPVEADDGPQESD